MGFSFFGLFGQTNKFKTVDAKEFAAFIKDTAKVTVLDVRTAAEHAEGFIPETHFNIDVLDESFEKEILEKIPHDSIVAIYCRSGRRSKTAGAILESNCYKVVELESGFNGWKDAGKDIQH